MTTNNIPETLIEAIQFYADLDNCHEFLSKKRWPDGKPICPHCGSDKIGKLSLPRRVWNCKGCKKQFSVKVGTIFEDSPIGLNKWLPAVWMIVNDKNGISSCELSRALGITQKSAWFMGHRIRLALHEGSFEKMSGHVEADETFIGAKARNMHWNKREEKVSGTGPSHMTPVMGLLERGKEEKPSRVQLHVLKGRKRAELQGHIRSHVNPGSEVHTDALRSYQGLEADYVHKFVDHAETYVKDNVHTNGLENFWSLLKRTVKGTYVCPAPFHLFRYLDEQAFRFNERKGKDVNRFDDAMGKVDGKRIMYKQLIDKVE
jgi:transposase-like protein